MVIMAQARGLRRMADIHLVMEQAGFAVTVGLSVKLFFC